MDQELVAYLDRRFDEFGAELRTELRADIAANAAETRRHFGVIAEDLKHTIQIVAEGVLTVNQKVDRLADEMRAGFAAVEGRLLRLESRRDRRRRRPSD